MAFRFRPASRGFFFTIEFGNFGWGATPKATLPHQRAFYLIRISWGPGTIDQGILSQMRKGD